MRILFLQNCFLRWNREKHLSYTLHGFGFEEGFRANDAEILILTNPWFRSCREICAGKELDQVWVNDLANLKIRRSDLFYLLNRSKVKVGIVAESLNYTEEEYRAIPRLRRRKEKVLGLIPQFTHILMADEKDVQEVRTRFPAVQVSWLNGAIPKQWVDPNGEKSLDEVEEEIATFMGSIYGPRKVWIRDPALKGLMQNKDPLENKTTIGFRYNLITFLAYLGNASRVPGIEKWHPLYVQAMRRLRRKSFKSWLDDMKWGKAVVNLPSFYKGYPGRIYESMAAGRPLISWKVPDRPQTERLFEDEKEILFFDRDRPRELAEQIERVKKDKGLAHRLAKAAREKLLREHTMEKRTEEILNWIQSDAKSPSS